MLDDVRLELIPIAGFEAQVEQLPPDAVVPVTCSPRVGIEATLRASAYLRDRGHRPVPHIAARMVAGPSHLREIIGQVDDLGLSEIFVVGGDIKDRVGPWDGGGALLEELTTFDHHVERIGIPAYPETHPLIGRADLTGFLKAKQPYADHMVSQICFDPDTILAWVADMRAQGVTLPLHVGIPGPMEVRKLLATSLRIGVGASARFLSKQRGLAAKLLSRYRPDHLVSALAPYMDDPDYAIAGFHVNTFNQVKATAEWLEAMRGTDLQTAS
ncbi:MAG: methylenetetrahydrofolate reductase [Solirubrobacterales bacterium]|nr:methylenetetrahydrofolate reductase [Solirubrobacterales bacterium]